MPKIDFEKVEMSFAKGLKKMAVKKLQDLAAKFGGQKMEPTGLHLIDKTQSRRQVCQALHFDLKKLHEKDKRIWTHFDLSKQEIKRRIEHPEELTATEWVELKRLKKQVEEHKERLLAPFEEGMNAGIVDNQRVLHRTKRFNIREDWLPLH